MRKLYALFAGFVISLACINSANARNVSPDVANFTFTVDAPNNNVFFTNTSTIGSEPGLRKACWHFGDGRDTCITYPANYTGVYGVSHLYAQPGSYNVCVSILYDGGCQAYKCHQIQVDDPDTCAADFERIASAGANPLQVYFKA